MQLPLQVAFQGMPHSPAVDARIREHVAKLEKHHSRLSSCRSTAANASRTATYTSSDS